MLHLAVSTSLAFVVPARLPCLRPSPVAQGPPVSATALWYTDAALVNDASFAQMEFDTIGATGGYSDSLLFAVVLLSVCVTLSVASGLMVKSVILPLLEPEGSAEPGEVEWLAGVALPSLEQLAEACVLITAPGSERELELCALPINDDCTPDEEFSAYYGRDVYVC